MGIAKLQMLLTAWEETDTTFSKVVRGAVWKMQSEVSARRGFCRGGVASGKRRYAGCPLGGATLNKTWFPSRACVRPVCRDTRCRALWRPWHKWHTSSGRKRQPTSIHGWACLPGEGADAPLPREVLHLQGRYTRPAHSAAFDMFASTR